MVPYSLRGVYACGDAHALRQTDDTWYESAQAFTDIVRGHVFGREAHHERQEGDGRGAVHQSQEEGDDEEGGAVQLPGHYGGLVPEEGQQDTGDHPDAEDDVIDRALFQAPRQEFVGDGDQQRANVGHLDDDRQVGGESPGLGEGVDDEREFHP